MRPRLPSIAWAYALVVVLFLGLAQFRVPYGEALRFPTLLFARTSGDGPRQVDHERLRRSIQRISPVRLARETGNSIRVASGQVLEWVIWGGREPLMLFPEQDLWVSRGLDRTLEGELARAAAVVAAYQQRLAQEGWTVVIVPVPTKLGIHRDLATWPVREPGLVSRTAIPEDRSDDVYRAFLAKLADRGVPSVDLQSRYRAALAERPATPLYIPLDSHWSGAGIELAARETARVIGAHSPVRARTPVDPTYFDVNSVGDLARAFDTLPALHSRLAPTWSYPDRLLSGDRTVRAGSPTSRLVVAVGTSYTAQYTWTSQPVGFASQLGHHLEDAEVHDEAAAGKGSFHAFRLFWGQRQAILADFTKRNGAPAAKVVAWEFPIRDVRSILSELPPP